MGQTTLITEEQSEEEEEGSDDGKEKRIAGYAEALQWAIDNPQALSDEHLKRYVEFIKKRVDERLQSSARAVI